MERGKYIVQLITAGLLQQRVAEAITRLTPTNLDEAGKLVEAAPVVIAQDISEKEAFKLQRELQMFGAVIDVSFQGDELRPVGSGSFLRQADPRPFPTDIEYDAPIEKKIGEYQVFILTLGPQPGRALSFLKTWLGKYQTLAAVEYRIKRNIKRVQPTLSGLAAETAQEIAARLSQWDIGATVYHAEDPNRPQYDHNRFGVTLRDAGKKPAKVVKALTDILSVNEDQAKMILRSLPSMLVKDVSIGDAIAIAERLSDAGAIFDLPETQPNVWLNTSTADIPRQDGSFVVILHKIGMQKLLLSRLVAGLRTDLTDKDIQSLLKNTPVPLVTGIDLATAEMIKMRIDDMGATAVIQPVAEYQAHGGVIHSQNPNFHPGSFIIVLQGFQRFKKISVIQEIRALIPGIRLTEITAMFDLLPVELIIGVDEKTAEDVQDRLQKVGAEVSVQ